jgi:hypothetical protein
MLEQQVRTPPDATRPDSHRPDTPWPDTRAWLQERIQGGLAGGVAFAWFVLLNVAAALEPPTRNPEPAIGVALQVGMWLLIATMITGLVMQRRFGLLASLGGAVLLTAAAIACPISGHHQFGAWWFGEMACTLTLLAISVFALRHAEHEKVTPPVN